MGADGPLLLGAVIGAVLVGVPGFAATRYWRVSPGRPGFWDLGFCVAALMWGSAWGSLLGLLVTGQPLPPGGQPPSLLASLIGSAVGGACCVIVAAARLGGRGLALHLPRSIWLPAGLLFLPPFYGLSAVWAMVLDATAGGTDEQQIVTLLRELWGTPQGLLAVGFAAIGAPLAEEVLFRGVALPALQRPLGSVGAVALTALVFGAMHGADPQSVPPLVVLGAALGWLRTASGSLWPSVILHMANNALVLGALALS